MRSALALVLMCSTAAAAPIATAMKDVDGDGSDDRLELDATGELRIETARTKAKVALPIKPQAPEAPPAKLGGASVRGTPTVIVQAGDQGFVLQPSGGTWKQVAKTTVGGVGLDAEYSVELDANADGVYRYQSRQGGRRCDGLPAYLFAERLESGKFVPLTKLPTGVPANAPVIAARPEPTPPASEPLTFKARFASTQPGAPDAGALAIPSELDDGKPGTVWREDLPGTGEGQFFTYTARVASSKAAQVRIVAAKGKDANRPKRIGVVSAQGAWHIDIPAGDEAAYVAELPTPITGCVTLVIESTYGTGGATSIAELEVYAEGERTGGGDASLARAIAEGGDGAAAAAQTLARRGPQGVAALENELSKTKDTAAASRLVRALLDNRDPSAGPVLAREIGAGRIAGADLVAAVRALAGLGQGQVLHDVAARQATPLDARVAAVRALNPANDAERDLLVELAGRGPRELRQAVIEVLTDVPVATLAPLADAQPKPAAAGDLWRAVTRRAHASTDAGERTAALTALTAALPKATDYERRYRIVDGIAAVGDAAALRALADLLKQWPAGEDTTAYKQVVAHSIAVNLRPDALDLVTTLATDADPGVRLAALSALAGATGGNAGAWHGPTDASGIDRVIQTRLATDTWPEVRRYSAQLLGARCTRPGPAAALADSVARDPEVDVRGDALAGLVECRAPSAATLLAKLWDDGKAPLVLRQRAVDLTVTLGDKALAAKLVSKFTRWRGAALESKAALGLVQNAAYAIGRLRAPGAADALIAALDDSAFPEIVAASAAGLGLLGPACPVGVRPKLKGLSRSDDQQVSTAAARAYEVCGK